MAREFRIHIATLNGQNKRDPIDLAPACSGVQILGTQHMHAYAIDISFFVSRKEYLVLSQ